MCDFGITLSYSLTFAGHDTTSSAISWGIYALARYETFQEKIWKEANRVAGQRSIYFVCSVALRPKSKAMVMAGRSVHLATLFPEQA